MQICPANFSQTGGLEISLVYKHNIGVVATRTRLEDSSLEKTNKQRTKNKSRKNSTEGLTDKAKLSKEK